MHEYTAMRVISLLAGILVVSAGCQKIPEPAPELPRPAEEKKIQALILSLAGEVGERDPKTGHITIVILSGDKVEDKVEETTTNYKPLLKPPDMHRCNNPLCHVETPTSHAESLFKV